MIRVSEPKKEMSLVITGRVSQLKLHANFEHGTLWFSF